MILSFHKPLMKSVERTAAEVSKEDASAISSSIDISMNPNIHQDPLVLCEKSAEIMTDGTLNNHHTTPLIIINESIPDVAFMIGNQNRNKAARSGVNYFTRARIELQPRTTCECNDNIMNCKRAAGFVECSVWSNSRRNSTFVQKKERRRKKTFSNNPADLIKFNESKYNNSHYNDNNHFYIKKTYISVLYWTVLGILGAIATISVRWINGVIPTSPLLPSSLTEPTFYHFSSTQILSSSSFSPMSFVMKYPLIYPFALHNILLLFAGQNSRINAPCPPMLSIAASFLPAAMASSSSGNNGNAPFLVMSEMIHTAEDDAGGASTDNNSGNKVIRSNLAAGRDDGNNGESVSSTSSGNIGPGSGQSVVNSSSNDNGGGGIDTSSTTGGGGGSWSDTDGEDLEDEEEADENNDGAPSDAELVGGNPPQSSTNIVSSTSTSASTVSQPLKTLKKLQAMLDDSDYATSTVTTGSVMGSSSNSDGNDVHSDRSRRDQPHRGAPMHSAPSSSTFDSGEGASSTHETHQQPLQTTATQIHQGEQHRTSTNSGSPNNPVPEKLWTSKDRSKYRRTRRTETHRQQYEEQRAREIREVQRQRIIREERERKELEELRRKQIDVAERQRQQEQKRHQMQQQLLQHEKNNVFFDETDFTEETDTDGKGFELPNLPVYLSDAEQTDDFSDEADDRPVPQSHSNRPPGFSYSHPSGMAGGSPQSGESSSIPQTRQGYQLPPQRMGQPYQYSPPINSGYNYPQVGQSQQQQQQLPPQTLYPEYRQQPLSSQQPQGQQHGPYSPYSQQGTMAPYQFNPNHQQMQEQQRQYEQQYTAWAQAAANGYYYPPPPHPSTNAFSSQRQQTQQSQQNPDSSYPPQYPYGNQQQQQPQPQSQPPPQDQRMYGSPYQQPYNAQGQTPPTISSYPSVPQASLPPPSQASQAASSFQGGARGFFTRDNTETQEWLLRRQQQWQQFNTDQNETPKTYPDNVQYSNNIDASSHSELNNSVTSDSSESNPLAASPFSSMEETFQKDEMVMMGDGAPSILGSSPLIQSNSLVVPTPARVLSPVNAEGPYCELVDDSAVLIGGAESKINFDSVQKLFFSTISVALLAYCAVSPRSLPVPEYNGLFLKNLSVVWLSAIAPVFSLLCVYDGKYNNINTAIGTFHVSFTLGYALAFVLEIIVTTALRLGVFMIWEPAIFSLTPEVPSIILPWVLREKQYRPKRITLFAADFATSCVASPIIEEYLKLKVVQWTCKLPRNFKPSRKTAKGKKRSKKNALQPVMRDVDDPAVTNINCYMTQMMAASLGLKLFDTTRRILMYTKKSDDYKEFYAICRGFFPIHELCGTMTALMLARRDVLGVKMPTWRILGPAVLIHGMANFRGMKPIFKWNSSTPWSEMQLYPWKVGSSITMGQLLSKSYAKIVWLTILCRVFGFCVKNYYLIGRQAMKRTTTYSGKLHAFSAKLETDEVLRKTKKD